jgi:hypothetical protein
MPISIEVKLTVRHIEAVDFNDAKRRAYAILINQDAQPLLQSINVHYLPDFYKMCKVYKEANGTFTVEIP